MKARLERSRQSARECRARKKLRYQYLEELVNHREHAVLLLRKEMETFKEWCKDVESGRIPETYHDPFKRIDDFCDDNGYD
ncbi:cAMP-responsive element-binding protein-like 2 [Chamberlinius hualienensis]